MVFSFLSSQNMRVSTMYLALFNLWECVCVCVCVCVCTQRCPTPCDPMDCSPPGSSVPGILQARILEWVAISFSRGSSRPRVWTLISGLSCIVRQILVPPGKPAGDWNTCNRLTSPQKWSVWSQACHSWMLSPCPGRLYPTSLQFHLPYVFYYQATPPPVDGEKGMRSLGFTTQT